MAFLSFVGQYLVLLNFGMVSLFENKIDAIPFMVDARILKQKDNFLITGLLLF